MFGFCNHYVHEIVITKKGTIILIDVSDTYDAGIEGAYAIFNEDIFRNGWEGPTWTIDDVKEWGEELDAFDGWEVVSSHHRSVSAAEKKLRAAIKNL